MGTELDRDTSQRIDRWLWHARFFKSRGLATEAVKLGRIAINGIRAKPAKPVRAGDTVLVTKSTLRYEVIVQARARHRPDPGVLLDRGTQ